MNEAMKLENEKMMEKCYAFMLGLKEILGDAYILGQSPFAPTSCYLVPKGTEELNTYYSKPPKSFRCSDHWNWYANLKKCSNPNYVQCYNVDAFWPYKRTRAGATKHIWQCCVGYFAEDNRFHVVYGQKFDRKTRETTWVEATPIEVLKEWLYDDPSEIGTYVARRIDMIEFKQNLASTSKEETSNED